MLSGTWRSLFIKLHGPNLSAVHVAENCAQGHVFKLASAFINLDVSQYEALKSHFRSATGMRVRIIVDLWCSRAKS